MKAKNGIFAGITSGSIRRRNTFQPALFRSKARRQTGAEKKSLALSGFRATLAVLLD